MVSEKHATLKKKICILNKVIGEIADFITHIYGEEDNKDQNYLVIFTRIFSKNTEIPIKDFTENKHIETNEEDLLHNLTTKLLTLADFDSYMKLIATELSCVSFNNETLYGSYLYVKEKANTLECVVNEVGEFLSIVFGKNSQPFYPGPYMKELCTRWKEVSSDDLRHVSNSHHLSMVCMSVCVKPELFAQVLSSRFVLTRIGLVGSGPSCRDTVWYDDPVVSRIEDKIAAWTFLPKENGEDIQVLRYEHGQKYDPHYDYFSDMVNIARGGHRVATVLTYLTDVEQGGETVFPVAEESTRRRGHVGVTDLSDCAKKGIAVSLANETTLGELISVQMSSTWEQLLPFSFQTLERGCPSFLQHLYPNATPEIRVVSIVGVLCCKVKSGLPQSGFMSTRLIKRLVVAMVPVRITTLIANGGLPLVSAIKIQNTWLVLSMSQATVL